MDLEAAGPAKKVPQDQQRFLDTFRGLAKDLSNELTSKYEQEPYVKQWVNHLMYYTIPGGKMNRGLSVQHALEALKGRALSEEEMFQTHVLGWCIEWLQAFFLISDDIMDQSVTRRGQPCYYLSPHPLSHPKDPKRATVGSIAINDSFIVESQIYVLLKKYFRSQPFYADLVDLFHETSYQTELGQLLDLTSLKPGQLDFSNYTLEHYQLIVRYKTAFYSFYLPVACAILMHEGRITPEAERVCKSILLPMGEFFQVQDDFLDCYGTPEQIGKVGRDIEEAKCGWLVVTALPLCSPQQRKVLQDNYGREEAASVARVKQVYKELNIEKIYRDYEEKSYRQLKRDIESQTVVKKEAFEYLLNKIYKRKK